MRVFWVSMLVFLLAFSGAATARAGLERRTVAAGGLTREYMVYAPPECGPARPCAVVMMFHGGGGTASAAMAQTGWEKKADKAGFLAVFPEGVRPRPDLPPRFGANSQSWNDGSTRFNPGVDDVGFVRRLLADLAANFALDPRRVYATGFSNGASMSFRLGAELPEVVAAIAPVAGAPWVWPTSPMPVLYITGTQDSLNPIEGGMPTLGPGGKPLGGRVKPPVAASLAAWARANGCPARPETVSTAPGVELTRFAGCQGRSETVYYAVEGLGHTWPGGVRLLPEKWVGPASDKLKATDVIWEFFEKHALP